MLESFMVSTVVTALAEIGDKSQLLAMAFAVRFKRPYPILIGIFLATVLNHILAVSMGVWIVSTIQPETLRIFTGLFLIAIAVWMLIPQPATEKAVLETSRLSIVSLTFITFFLAEMGDKSQLVTLALTVHYSAPLIILCGTTLGILLIDIPAVFLGKKIASTFSQKLLLVVITLLFMLIGLLFWQ